MAIASKAAFFTALGNFAKAIAAVRVLWIDADKSIEIFPDTLADTLLFTSSC
jgi:hypothetical protein